MDRALKAHGKRATIVGATSGDTGAAAIEAFRGLDQVDVFILYPHGRVSDVQRRQMTTVAADNIHAIALEGTFDDAQAMLKSFFRNKPLREELGLSGVNSINFARVVAQMVYYFTAAAVLGGPLQKSLLHRADRQFRRHSRRPHGPADGAADRKTRRRHQFQRHSRPRARNRAL